MPAFLYLCRELTRIHDAIQTRESIAASLYDGLMTGPPSFPEGFFLRGFFLAGRLPANRFQISPEERALLARLGAPYETYLRSVRALALIRIVSSP
jgi:hypothetical protein